MFVFGQKSGLMVEPPSEKSQSFVNALDGLLLQLMKFSTMPWLKYILRSQYKQLSADLEFFYKIGFELIDNIVNHIKKVHESGDTIDDDIRKSLS